jgi:hypothetical protein
VILATIHVAGPVVGVRQECARCGHVLEDWTGQSPAVVAVPGQEPEPLPMWPVGKRIGVAANATFVMGDDIPLDPATDRECRPAS